jgi:hypothetical protein
LPKQHSRGSSGESDPKAEHAARKVRRTAEIRDAGPLSEKAKDEVNVNEFEAHAELERPKHYKGQPDRS